jgi:two-component system cell cycle response regulator DivK
MSHALIIDDNRNNIDVLVMLLDQEGVSHTAVQSVRQVENALVQTGQVDVVFLDLEFPVGDGFQILDALKAMPRFQAVPIVAYSVHTSEIDVVRRAGFDGFLGKPLSRQHFPEQLQRILSGHPVWEV